MASTVNIQNMHMTRSDDIAAAEGAYHCQTRHSRRSDPSSEREHSGLCSFLINGNATCWRFKDGCIVRRRVGPKRQRQQTGALPHQRLEHAAQLGNVEW